MSINFNQFKQRFAKVITSKSTNYKEETLELFAADVYETMRDLIKTGQDKQTLLKAQKDLLKSMTALQKKLDNFTELQKELRLSFHSIPSIAPFTISGGESNPIYQFNNYTHDYIEELSKLNFSRRGPNNVTSLLLAKSLAKRYYKYLQLMPYSAKHGSGRESIPPFDRLCNLITEEYKIEISESTRIEAIKFIKKQGGK